MSLSKTEKAARKKRKAELLEVFGYRCGICGYYRCDAALEFHHVNPKDKLYSLSDSKFRTLEEDLEEAKNPPAVDDDDDCTPFHSDTDRGNR